MIKVNFNNHVSGKNRKTIRTAVEFFLRNLLPTRKANNTDLTVRFVRLPCKFRGFCAISEDEDNVYSPKSFTIDIAHNLSLPKILETLAHEMVHLRQFRNRELGYRANYTVFRGRAYSLDTPYEKEPWEREAYDLESGLVKKFVAFSQQGQ